MEANEWTLQQWTLQPPLPEAGGFSKPIVINNEEFIVAKVKYYSSPDEWYGILKYNANTKQCIKWIEYPSDIIDATTWHTLAFDNETKIVYIFGAESSLITLNLNTKQFKIYKNNPECGAFASSTVINNTFHIIGGDRTTKHLMWDITNKCFTTNHIFQVYLSSLKPAHQFYGHALIFHKMKNRLLLFGGSCNSLSYSDTIYSYDISNNKWILLNDTMPMKLSHCGYVKISDKYVIIIGGNANITDNDYRSIFICDLDTMKWKKSKMKSPISGSVNGVVVGMNKMKCLLVTKGYLRQCWKIFDNIATFPDDLVQLIANWYDRQFLHVLKPRVRGQHWGIPIDAIFA
eukprot:259566_1